MADVGSNGGFFTLLSRSLGCTAVAVDAQPRCLQRLASAAALNGFAGDGVRTVWTAVGALGSAPITVGATRCSGLWAVSDDSAWINLESSHNASVPMTPLDTLLTAGAGEGGGVGGVGATGAGGGGGGPWLPDGAALTLLKIDAEGSEVAVLRTALPLLEARRIEGVLAEVVPRRVQGITPLADVSDTFTRMYAAGYVCATDSSRDPLPLDELLGFFAPDTELQTGEHWMCYVPHG